MNVLCVSYFLALQCQHLYYSVRNEAATRYTFPHSDSLVAAAGNQSSTGRFKSDSIHNIHVAPFSPLPGGDIAEKAPMLDSPNPNRIIV